MDTIKNLEIVIARYKENLHWINKISVEHKRTIYNKFYPEKIYLANIGREGHTYLYHIYNNYDNLSELILFTQGDPIFHDFEFVKKINSLELNLLQLSKPLFFGITGAEGVNGNYYHKHPNGLPIYYFLDLLFDIKCLPTDQFIMHYGSIFLVSKEIILSRPKNFYKFLLNMLSYEIDPIEGYIVERLWKFILDPTIPISSKYKIFVENG